MNFFSRSQNISVIKRFFTIKKDWEVGKVMPSLSVISKWVNNYLSLHDTEKRLKLCEESFLDLSSSSLSSTLPLSSLPSPSSSLSTATQQQQQQQHSSFNKSQLLLVALSSTDDGIKFCMTLRSDILLLLQNKKHHEGLLSIDSFLSKWLFSVFCISALKLQRVTFDTSSGLLLEKIAAEEAVHRIRALSEMKNRLTNGRRCFGFFHPW